MLKRLLAVINIYCFPFLACSLYGCYLVGSALDLDADSAESAVSSLGMCCIPPCERRS